MTKTETIRAEYKAAVARAKAALKAYISTPVDDMAALREAGQALKAAEMKRDRLAGRLLHAAGAMR